MNPEEKEYKRIEKYLAGSLAQEELLSFELELKSNPELGKEVNLHKELGQALTEDDVLNFRNTLKKVVKNESELHQRTKPSKWKYLSIAATISVLLLITLGVNEFFLNKPVTHELFESYYEPYEDLVTGRSDEAIYESIAAAMMLYSKEDYAQAITYFQKIDKDNKPLLSLYAGISYLNLNDFKSAHDTFILASEKNNLFSLELKWYNALTYLKEGNKSKAKIIFAEIANSPNNSSYKQKARNLLEELN